MEYRIGQVRERTGLTARQIREWVRRGLIRPSRGTGGQRLYSEGDVETLVRAMRMRAAGLQLAEIPSLLQLLRGVQLGAESKGIELLGSALRRMRGQLDIAEELTGVLREAVSRRPPSRGT